METSYSISEYGKIGTGNYDGYKYSSEHISQKNKHHLRELKEFNEKSSNNFFRIVDSNTLQAVNNYVGVIQTNNVTLEILPKIYDDEAKGEVKQKNRNILNKMLLKINRLPTEIKGSQANLDAMKDMNIFEVFISMFANSIEDLIQKGIKSDYITVEDNLNYLKGKIQFSNHIRYNLAHKEKFYVEFDEYIEDRVENRLLKTCINFLLDKSKNNENQSKLREQLFFFDKVSYSTNIEYDLSCVVDLQRGMEYYDLPLKFAKIFLKHESFTPTRGDNAGFSFLFPMDKIFESYVEELLKDCQNENKISQLTTNYKGTNKETLLTSEDYKYKNIIGLEPDYTFYKGDNFIVSDAKWKLIEEVEKNNEIKNEIKREDIYQIYSYMNYFGANTSYIFAPKTNESTEVGFIFKNNPQNKTYGNLICNLPQRKLHIIYIDLDEPDTKLSLI